MKKKNRVIAIRYDVISLKMPVRQGWVLRTLRSKIESFRVGLNFSSLGKEKLNRTDYRIPPVEEITPLKKRDFTTFQHHLSK